MLRVAVVGAGIAGLGAAYRLQQAGCTVTVFEKSGVVGGRMQTVSMHEFTWESGAQFMVRGYYTRMMQFMKELEVSLSDHKINSMQAFLLPDGQLYYMCADSPIDILRQPAISLRSKLRMLKVLHAAYRYRTELDPHTPEKTASIDTESLREWGDREIRGDAVDHFLSLSTSTLFFWRPEETPWWYAASFALLTRRWHVVLPAGGMGAVPVALAKHLDIKLLTEVHRIDVNNDGSVTLCTGSPTGQTDLTVDYVVLATPASITLELLANPEVVLGEVVTDFLHNIRYVRNATTAVAYRTAPETCAYGVSIPTILNHLLAGIISKDLTALRWERGWVS